VALGEKLFNDKRISVNDKVSCATCHDPAKGFVDHKPLAEGVAARPSARSGTADRLNAMFNAVQFWTTRPVARGAGEAPILNRSRWAEKTSDDVVNKLRGIAEVPAASSRCSAMSSPTTTRQRDRPFERHAYGAMRRSTASSQGREGSTTRAAAAGALQRKGRCNNCHAFSTVSPLLLRPMKFHTSDRGRTRPIHRPRRKATPFVRGGDLKQIDELAIRPTSSELGRFLVTKSSNGIGAFRRRAAQLAITSAYMHDGSFATLWTSWTTTKRAAFRTPNLDGGMQRLGLTKRRSTTRELHGVGHERQVRRVRKQEMARQQRRRPCARERDTAVATGKRATSRPRADADAASRRRSACSCGRGIVD